MRRRVHSTMSYVKILFFLGKYALSFELGLEYRLKLCLKMNLMHMILSHIDLSENFEVISNRNALQLL